MTNSLTIIRSYRGASDLQALVDLFDACEAVDKLDLSISTAQLQLEIEAPGIDLDRDLRLWEDEQGQVIGFGELSIAEPIDNNLADGTLWMIVHPVARGGDLEAQIITWAEHRIGEVAKDRNGQPKLFTWSRDSRIDRITIIKQHGFVEDRHFFFLTQPLTKVIPIPQLPEGFTIRAVNLEREAQAWADLHNQAFFGQWNYHPITVESCQHRLQNPNYLPELDLVAISQREGSANDTDGKFAAICYCAIDREHNTFLGRNEGWVALLFTSPDFQRRGLARAMLLNGLARLKALNIDIAKIGVDSENAFGAKQLYESAGFKPLYTNIAYVKHLSI
jgi:mycothiol synthase